MQYEAFIVILLYQLLHALACKFPSQTHHLYLLGTYVCPPHKHSGHLEKTHELYVVIHNTNCNGS